MTQLGSMNGTSSLKDLTDLKAKSSKPLQARSPEKPDSSFADLIQRQDTKITPRKPVDEVKSAERPEKAEKRDGTEEKSKASKDAQIDQNNDPGKADKGEKKNVREKAMLEFMDSMESELGIPPTDIVAAMAELKPSDLTKSPEETAQQVIQNLDLPPEEQGKALALYMAFLQQSKAADLKPDQMFIQKNGDDLASQIQGMDKLSAEQRKDKMSQSLDSMNNKFFLQDAAGSQRTLEARQAEAQKLQALRDKLGMDSPDAKPGALEIPLGMELQKPETLDIPKAKQPFLTELEMEALAEKPAMTPDQANVMKAALEKLKGKAEKANPDDFFAIGALKAQMQEGLPQNVRSAKDQNAQPVSTEMGPVQVQANNTQGDSQNLSDMFAKSESGNDQAVSAKSTKTAGKVTADDFFSHLGMGSASKSESPQTLNAVVAKNEGPSTANLEKIADQAKLISFKGGGEAVVKLNEEGLGEIQLKVHVKDGKVNLEMATETKEAKKLLESSMSELRSSLAGHKLSIDQVKVDVGNQTSSDSQKQQQSMDARPDLNQGKQFMSQFRDEMSGRRDQFFEMPGIRSYQTKRQTPDPIGAAPEVGAASRKSLSPGRGQRMNLVA